MSKLTAIQKLFGSWLVHGTTPSDRADQTEVIEATVCGDDLLSAANRVDIYWRMFRVRMFDSLAEDFPKVRDQVGEDRFWDIVARYIAVHRSESYTLADAGQHFAAFLTKTETVELGELADFEWQLIVGREAVVAPREAWNPDTLLNRRFRLASGVTCRHYDTRSETVLFYGSQRGTNYVVLGSGLLELLARLGAGQTLEESIVGQTDEAALPGILTQFCELLTTGVVTRC